MMVTRGGTLIGEAGAPPDPARDDDDRITGTRQSSRYALDVIVSLPRDSVALSQGDLRALGTVVSGTAGDPDPDAVADDAQARARQSGGRA